MKIAPEGYPFVVGFALVTAAVYALAGFIPAIVSAVLTLFMLYFFRDPERTAPVDPDVFVAPADGRVIFVRDIHESRHLQADMKEVCIFMSPLNVHVNRAPCDGTVRTVAHNKGSFFAAYREDASIKNENIEMVLTTKYGDILVRQVAGFVARRAVCRKREGETLLRGERYGLIKFSSRLDVCLPPGATVTVRVGDRVTAGETIIARI